MNFSESYFRTLSKTKFISIISLPFLAYLLVVPIFNQILLFFTSEGEFEGNLNETIVEIGIGLGFQTIIAILLITRFGLLCSPENKFIWIAQFVWLITWLSIFGYYFASETIRCGSIFLVNCPSNFGGEHIPYLFIGLFDFSSTLFLITYWVLSPLKQILFLVISFFSRK